MNFRLKSVFQSAVIAFGMTAMVTTIASIPSAHATSIAQLTIEQKTDASTYIVRGIVEDVWSEFDGNVVRTHARVRVKKVLKGPNQPEEVLVTTIGGIDGEHETLVSGSLRYTLGEEAYFFLEHTNKNTLVPVAWSAGKYLVRRAPGDPHSYAAYYDVPMRHTYDSRFLPHPSHEMRLYTEQLEKQVTARVKAGWDGQPIPGISNEKLEHINAITRKGVQQ